MSIPLFPPTTQPLDLGEWNPEAKGQLMHVWVDPPRGFLQERQTFQKEYRGFLEGLLPAPPAGEVDPTKEANRRAQELQDEKERAAKLEAFLKAHDPVVHAWYVQLWSHGPDTAEVLHPTMDEMEQLDESNPKFLGWLIRRSNEILDAYRGAEKKG